MPLLLIILLVALLLGGGGWGWQAGYYGPGVFVSWVGLVVLIIIILALAGRI